MAKAEAKVEELERGELRLPKHDQGIFATAFRDELVPQDPDEESVSVLLQRTKTDVRGGASRKRR